MSEHREIYAENGEKMNIQFETELKLEFPLIPSTKYNIKAYILNKDDHDRILGIEFMMKNHVILNFYRSSISIEGYEVFSCGDETPFPDQILIERSCTIPENKNEIERSKIIQEARIKNLSTGKFRNKTCD